MHAGLFLLVAPPPAGRPPRPLRHRPALLAVVALAALSGCASTGSSGSAAYRAELGRAPSAQTMAGVTAEVLQLYGYEIESIEPDLIQAGWRYLPNGVRDRATVRVRPRANDIYNGSIRIVVERQNDVGSWRPDSPGPELRDEYGRIQANVRTRLQRFMTQN